MAYAKKSIGDGESIFFDMIFGWEESSLAYIFPRLFSLSTEKNNKVSQMKSWVGSLVGRGSLLVGRNKSVGWSFETLTI